MKAERLFTLFEDRGNADVYVNVEGEHIPVVSARYDPGNHPQVIIGLDRLRLLLALEKIKHRTDEK